MLKSVAKSIAKKKLSQTQKRTFAGSDVETRRPWQLKTLTWTFRMTPSCIGWVLMGWVGYDMVWHGVGDVCFFGDSSFSHYKIGTGNPWRWKIAVFRGSMVSTQWEPMTLYVAVTQQVNITIKCCSDHPKKICIKWGTTLEPSKWEKKCV